MQTRIARSCGRWSGECIPDLCWSIANLANYSASYRDLLGTAERIIEMDRQMQHVESTLGVIGQRCNSRRLDSISKNYRGLAAYSRKLGELFSSIVCCMPWLI